MAGKEKPVGPGGGEPTFAPLPVEWGDTVHLDVVDAAGNMISATPSGGWLQGSPVVPGLGFPISTRGQMCWLEEGHPTTLRGGSRPRITLSPTLVTRDGAPYLALGTPGGDQQEQWTLSVFLRVVHHRMSLQQAIDAPMFQTRHAVQSFHPRPFEPGRVVIEDRFPAATRDELAQRGHLLTVEGPVGARTHLRGRALGRIFARRRDAAADAGLRGGAVGRVLMNRLVWSMSAMPQARREFLDEEAPIITNDLRAGRILEVQHTAHDGTWTSAGSTTFLSGACADAFWIAS